MSRRIENRSFNEYVARINKAIDFARLHIEREITLDELAQISNFSKFHFHRIFKGITNVTPNTFIVSLKLNRARYILTNNPHTSLSEVAHIIGFSSISSFSKAFKKAYKLSPKEWRAKESSKIGQRKIITENYLSPILLNQNLENMELKKHLNIEIKELEDIHVIYIRSHSIHVHDSDGFAKMFNTLIEWASSKKLVNFPDTKALTIYRSLPDSKGMIQADASLSVPKDVKGDGIIGKTIIKGGKYLILHKEGTLDECFSAWDYLYSTWFPNSEYQPDERGVYLNHLNDAKTHPKGLHIFDMCISIKPL